MSSLNNSDKRDKISQALNKHLPPEVSVAESTREVNTHLNDDYEASRETYKELIVKGNEAIDLMMELARDSQHPRAFEVLATLSKTQGDNNDKLFDLQKRLKSLKEPTKGSVNNNGSTTTNNTIFCGTTTELQRFIMQQKKNDVIDIDSTV